MAGEKDVPGCVIDTGLAIVINIASPESNMQTTKTVANGANQVERKAASDANAVQSAVNLVAIVGAWHRHLLEMHRAGICGDNLINHPVNLAFVSKLNSLCRMNLDREMAALSAIDKIEQGESVEYEVIPL